MQPNDETVDETGLQLLEGAGIGKLADIQVTKDDIVTIAVAKREQELLGQRSDLEEELVKLRKQHAETQTLLEESVEAQVQGLRDNYVDSVDALLACGFKNVKLDLTHEWEETKSGAKITVVAELSCGSRKGRDEGCAGSISATQMLKVDADGTKHLKTLATFASSIELAEKTLLSVRRDLGQLSSLERQAKAQVALQLLNNSKAGKQLLSMMEKPNKLLTIRKA